MIIPARFASTRFPGKPLADINGKPMIAHVVHQVKKAQHVDRIVVATDNNEIAHTVEQFGGEAMLTVDEHPSGTDRCLEAYNKLGEDFDVIINVQGDEPFIHPDMIDTLVEIMVKPEVKLGTLVKRVEDIGVLLDPNKVKVVLNNRKEALYFSRSPIPFAQGSLAREWLNNQAYYKHIGMYGYTPDSLREITHLEVSSLEKTESLEQLRWLENGMTIRCGITKHESPSVDTPEDLQTLLHTINV